MSGGDTGIAGWPVAHSLSPVIHRYWRARHGIPGDYHLFPIDPAHFNEQIQTLKRTAPRGFNVTVPHKETILSVLDTVDAAAHHIGAVNTVVRDGPTWRGTNTDAYGFITHLTASGPVSLDKTVLLGAGGAARAAIVALQEAGAKQILLLNRTRTTAEALAAEFGVRVGDWQQRDALLEGASLLANTTVLGMKGKPALEVSLTHLPVQATVYDIVYVPLETPLLAAARARGNRAVDGLGMLLYQAQRAFAEWHGVLPEVDEGVRQAVLAEIARREAMA